MARHGPGQGEEQSDAAGTRPEESSSWCRRRLAVGRRLGDRKSSQPPAAADPFAETTAAAAPPSEFSDAVSIQIPTATPTSARKPYFIFGDATNSVDLWFFDLARPEPLQFTGRGSAAIEPTTRGSHRCRELQRGRVVGDLQAAASRQRRRSVRAWRVFANRSLGVGRVLARSRQPARSHGLNTPSTWSRQVVPSAIGPMVRTALIILVIELAVIGWVRWRNKQNARAEPSAPSDPQ